MAHLTQIEGNINKIMLNAQKNHGGVFTKMGLRSARLNICRRNVGIRMCCDRVPKDDADHERYSLSFGETKAVNSALVSDDWRSFRARLINSNYPVPLDSQMPRNVNTAEWAHEISNIEQGCVLVATDKLQFNPLLSESVVLLLRWPLSSTFFDCRGIVLNKTFPDYCNHMDLADPMLTDLCAPKFVGGPALGSSVFGSKFHLLTTQRGLAGFDCVLPGLYAGNKGVCLQSAIKAGGVRMRLYLGELEMEKRHLTTQVEAFGWWKVVACSSSAIFSTNSSSPAHMWRHINQLLIN